jgi:2-iminobutanoate/2-iminopropanoate deaminase
VGLEHLRSPDLSAVALPLSHAVRAGDFLFVSGQASTDDAGAIVHDTFSGEVRRTFANLRRVLAAAGLDFSRVVQMRCYVARQEDLAEYNRLYAELVPAPHPARTTLIGCLGTVVKFEADAVAYCGR